MEEKFVVYENWRVSPKKAMVHKFSCGQAHKDQSVSEKINDNWLINVHEQNGRWFGYFNSLNEAIAFSTLLPNRELQICGHCLREFKNSL
jgi:hypothetical protein